MTGVARFALAVGLAGLAAAPPAGAFREEHRPVGADLLGVGAGARSLVFGYWGGGCEYEAKPTTTESRDRVTVSLAQRVVIPEGDHEGCSLVERRYSIRVRLRAPLAGRALRPLGAGFRQRGLAAAPRVKVGGRYYTAAPRVTGLSTADAEAWLRGTAHRTVCARTRREPSQVVGPSPRPGRALTARAPLTLAISCGRRQPHRSPQRA